MSKLKNQKVISEGFIIFLFVILFLTECTGNANVIIDGSIKYQIIAGFEVTVLGMMGDPSGFGVPLSVIGQQLVTDFGFRIIRIRPHLRDFEPVNDNADPLAFNWSVYNTIFSQQKFVDWFQNVKAMHDAGGQIHFSAFLPPDWMIVEIETRRYKLDPGFPRPDLYQEIAELWAAPLVYLRDIYEVEVEYCVVWTEPLYGEPFKFTKSELVETIKAMGQRFAAERLNTKILVPDGANIINYTLPGVHTILADPAAVLYAGGVAYHAYDGWPDREEPDNPKRIRALKKLANDTTIAASGLELFMTEWALTGSDLLRGQALAGAKHIYNCHVFGRTSVVDLWYVGPLAWIDPANTIENNGNGDIRWRKQIYAWKQFAKFIEPGSERIEVSPTVSSGTSVPAVSAYLHPTSHNLTIVAINRASSSRTINVFLQNLAGYGTLEVYRTSAVENTAFIDSLTVSGDAFTYDLPAESVMTFTTNSRED